jgi:polar amino acid transport system substrate-binding protein
MKLIKCKVLLVTLFVLTLIFTSTSFAIEEKSTLDKVLDEGVLKVGIMLDFPPCGYYDDNGKPAGYEVDIANKIAEMLEVKLEIVETPGPSRIPALEAGKVDVVFGSLAITPKRAAAVAFTRPYIYNSQWIITKKDSGIENFEDIAGKKIGTVTGTTPEINIMKTVGDWENKPEIVSYTSNADALMALRQGKVDALAEAKIWFESQINSIFPDQYKLVGPAFYKELCGAAVRREDQEFLNWLNTALWTMTVLTQDMNDLNKKYYGIPLDDEVYWGLN